MRKLIILSLSSLFVVEIMLAQTVVLLPSAGLQTTLSTVEGSSPVLSSNRQYQTNFSGSLRAYIDNKKGHGLFIGITGANSGISVKTFDINSSGIMSSSSTNPRIELGYQLITKPIYLNSILKNGIEKDNAEFNKGLFFQLQPMVGLGYNIISNDGGTGSIGGGTTSLKDIYSRGRNYSFLTGGNLYIGKNGKQWFFISGMKNWNFGNYSAQATLSSQYNGNIYQNNIKSYGSGTSFSIGMPIRIGGKRRN
ncbi:MAG: hypothetical protein WKF85_14500 [Chitinophagaceae bacterium]